jgi:hypothetical protein
MAISKRDVTFRSGDSFAAGWFFLPEDAGSGAAVPAVAMACLGHELRRRHCPARRRVRPSG